MSVPTAPPRRPLPTPGRPVTGGPVLPVRPPEHPARGRRPGAAGPAHVPCADHRHHRRTPPDTPPRRPPRARSARGRCREEPRCACCAH
ncbi:hypothetical protein AD006_14140 [Pseudonocardia sp. EC080610-09]|nr:hypothetical protein FRP1_06520 [Pseudonocardia sp. EC080625-04]ALL76171.1 hypothetical protein AD006_14140 [Pseudonocardia sp. EC080610-09]